MNDNLVNTVYWCRHCGKESTDKAEIITHCQEKNHNGVVQSPNYGEIDSHSDDAAVQWVVDRKDQLSEYQQMRLIELGRELENLKR